MSNTDYAPFTPPKITKKNCNLVIGVWNDPLPTKVAANATIAAT